MSIHESGEMYLETILQLSTELPVVRAIDITEAMNYSKPSVSRALKILETDGYIETSKRKYITLTEKGYEIAKKILERHKILTEILVRIGVERKTAEEDACKIEHDLSNETFMAIKKYFDFK